MRSNGFVRRCERAFIVALLESACGDISVREDSCRAESRVDLHVVVRVAYCDVRLNFVVVEMRVTSDVGGGACAELRWWAPFDFKPNIQMVQFTNNYLNKKLCYRRVTARCVLSVVILPITTQQCRNYLYDKS